MTLRLPAAAALVLLFGAVVPANAGAYCAPGSSILGFTAYRLLVHPALAAQMLHTDGTPWTSAELDRTVWHMVSSINESANANIPFLYFDYINDPTCNWNDTNCTDGVDVLDGCFTANTVILVPDNCGATRGIGGPIPGSGLIYIPTTAASGIFYSHGLFTGIGDNFEHVILHEMGHGFGLGHPDGSWGALNCNPAVPGAAVCPPGSSPGCPVMLGDRGTGYSGLYYGPDDVNGLQFVWGRRTSPGLRVFEDNDLSASPTFWELWPTNVDVAGYLSASSRPWEFRSTVTVAGLRRLNNNQLTVFGWNWANGSISWTASLSPSGWLSGPVGATEAVSDRVVSAHFARADGTARHYHRRLFEARSPLSNPGTGWLSSTTNPGPTGVDNTITGGVASAFHPLTQAVIHAIRDNGAQVILLGRVGSTWSNPVATGIRSYVAPAVACAGSAPTCMLAVVEPMPGAVPGSTSVSTRLQWIEFGWNQTGGVASWTPDVLRTSSWSMTGAISAAVVDRVGAPDDFFVTSAFIQTGGTFGSGWGTRTFAYRHPLGSTTMSLMLPQVSEVVNEFSFSPAGGTSEYAESFVITPP